MSDEREGGGRPRDPGARPREGREPREPREPRLRDIARRIFREGEEPTGDERTLRMDAREVVGAMLETGDKAKTEVVRMVAREVRAYLDELKIKEDLRDLITNYSLEVHASVHLKPLHPDEPEPSTAAVGLRRKRAPTPPVGDEGDVEDADE